MVSKKVRLTWLYEFPTIVPGLMQEGFNVFHFEASGDKKRVQLSAWRKINRNRRFECTGTETEGCGLLYVTKGARTMHQRATSHTGADDHPLVGKKERKHDALSRLEEIPEMEA